MNPRFLLIPALVFGSVLGASIAIKTYPNDLSIAAGLMQPTVPPSLNQSTQPLQANAPLPTAVHSTLDPKAVGELDQIKLQLHRAIRERNLGLLRSLMQAGSLREALRSVGAAESMNFENLDHSTWPVLEKAINYRCRQSIDNLEARSCFERQPPQPRQ